MRGCTLKISRICGQAAVVCGQDSILLFIIFEHVIGVPAIGLIWSKTEKDNCYYIFSKLTTFSDAEMCEPGYSPHLYPETQDCQSCGSLLHPRAPGLSLCAHHWSGHSLLHLWNYLRNTTIHIYAAWHIQTRGGSMWCSHMATLIAQKGSCLRSIHHKLLQQKSACTPEMDAK